MQSLPNGLTPLPEPRRKHFFTSYRPSPVGGRRNFFLSPQESEALGGGSIRKAGRPARSQGLAYRLYRDLRALRICGTLWRCFAVPEIHLPAGSGVLRGRFPAPALFRAAKSHQCDRLNTCPSPIRKILPECAQRARLFAACLKP